MNQFTEAATKLEEAAAILRAVTLPPMTVRGLPTPAPVEPQAGQVWTRMMPGPLNGEPFILENTARGWTTRHFDGTYVWAAEQASAADAVKGLVYAAAWVPEYFQAELRAENERLAKRVAELEAERAELQLDRDGWRGSFEHLKHHDMVNALASARKEGAKAAREERFQASRISLGWGVWDNEKLSWHFVGLESDARAEAARLNAEHAKENP